MFLNYEPSLAACSLVMALVDKNCGLVAKSGAKSEETESKKIN